MPFTEKETEWNCHPPSEEMGRPGSAAGRALDNLLSSVYSPATQAWLMKQLVHFSAGKGLHFRCGDGSNSLLMASLLGRACCMTETDEDSVLIEKALIHKKSKGLEHIHFTQRSLEGLETYGEFDFIFSQLHSQDFPLKAGEWVSLSRLLRKGGPALFQIPDISGFHSSPYNYAFARSVEIIGKLGSILHRAAKLKDFVTESPQDAGFKDIEALFSTPGILKRESNHLLSFFLEWRREDILINEEGLNASLLELKQCEKQLDTIITRPGMYHIRATKPDLKSHHPSYKVTSF